MKQQVLKALANPSRIFYVPYSLAVLNFAVQFVIFMVVFLIVTISTHFRESVNPMYFLISVCVVHMILAAISKKEPQLGHIVSAKIRLIKDKIPRRLAA